jgi:cell shape-determining protein MreC
MGREAFVDEGDLLVTASLQLPRSGKLSLPDGLPVADILKVRANRLRPLFLDVTAAPRVDLQRLEEVEVLVPVSLSAPPEKP